jgi:hypothetical protein
MARTIPAPYMSDDAVHIEVVISNNDPIELFDFTSSLFGMAREYQSIVQGENPEIQKI